MATEHRRPLSDAGRRPTVQSGLIGYLVRHRTAANLLLCMMLLGGVYAATQLRAQFLPDIVLESVNVTVPWPGAGPEDVDRVVVATVQPVLIAVEGVEATSAVAREGTATITVEFESGWDMSRAMDEIKAAVDGIRNLPENTEEPAIRRNAWFDRVTDVVIHGPVEFELLERYATEFQAKLFEAGITRTHFRGIADPVIRVAVPEARMIEHDLSLKTIADSIRSESEADPAGDLGTGTARVRTGTDRRTAETLGAIAIRSLPDGSKLYLRDIATIDPEGADKGVAYFRRDNPAIIVRVDRNDQGDAIEIQKNVEEIAESIRPTLPRGVEIQLTRTRAEAISDRLDILIRNGAFGLVLVLVFLFLFLSARTAFWVAMGIPAAMAATLALMLLFGLTLNMISLFALIICLGVVVDDAIVVGEHADFLARNHGLAPADAATSAATRMAAPVFSASITTVIAFMSLIFIGGRFGELIIAIPITVSMVLIASLVESFLVLPAHMRHALAAKRAKPWYDWPSRTFNRGFRWFRDRLFVHFVRFVAYARYPAIGAAIMVLLITLSLYFDGTVRWRFFNAPERGTISANIAMLPGASRDDTAAMLTEMQRALDEVDTRYARQHGQAPVVFSLATLGGNVGRGLRSATTKSTDLLGGLSIELIDPDLRPYSAFTFIEDWQNTIRRHRLLETLALRGQRFGPGGDAIDLKLFGPEPETLKQASELIKQRLSSLPAVSALEDTLAYDKSEILLNLTAGGEALGFSTDQIGEELYNRLRGIDAAEFPVGTRTGTIRVSLPESELTAAFLSETSIRTPGGGYVPLSEIVSTQSRFGFSTVRRENGRRVIRITGDIAEDNPDDASRVATALSETILPEAAARFGVAYQFSGLAEQERDFLNDAVAGLGLCLAGIYLVLAWIFASWTRPLLVMAVIPFGLIGAIWGHHWHGLPISMFSVVGFIGMSGIIINDSIVLVTTIDGYARRMPFIDALVEGVADRLRPVLLTTLTTVFGLAPLLFEQSRQAQFLLPTVITLAYGLGFGVLVVLVITPALLAIHNELAAMIRSARRLLQLATGSRRRRQIAGT